MLYLTEEDVARLLTMEDAIREVERALREMGEGRAENRPRQRVLGPGSLLSVMAGGLPSRGYFGFKYYSVTRDKVRFWFHLLDAKSGELVAVFQANGLGQRRTGAASGVATEYLARRDAAVVGIVGTGWQAESQLEAMGAVRSLREVRCYGREPARRRSFASKMAERLNVHVWDVETAERAVRDADIVITATDSREPVLHGSWLAKGTHVNAMGSNRPDAREIDDDAVSRSTCILCDSLEQAKMEAGDLILPVSKGTLRWEQVHELGEVVAGKIHGRTGAEDITLFKSLGIALEDVAVGSFVYEKARKEGIGEEIPI